MLEYTEQLYTAAEVDALKAELLERGSVTLPNVYQRHTVPEFRAAVLAAHSLGNLSSDLSQGGGDDTGLVVQPILAPRLMQFMPSAAGPEHPRGSSSQVSVFNIGVNVQGNPGEASPPGNWHRDRGRAAWLHDGEPSFPEQVSVVVSPVCVLHPPPRLPVDTHGTPRCCAWTAAVAYLRFGRRRTFATWCQAADAPRLCREVTVWSWQGPTTTWGLTAESKTFSHVWRTLSCGTSEPGIAEARSPLRARTTCVAGPLDKSLRFCHS